MWFRAITLLVIAVLSLGARAVQQRTVTVLAAISLREVLTELKPAYEKQAGVTVDLVLGASGQLSAQVKNGAPADVLISASDRQVQELIEANLADRASRTVIATNGLVLVVSAKRESMVTRLDDLPDPRVRRIAIGEPRSVPAGAYAMQALEKLGLVSTLKEKLVYGANVKQAADYVARGEAEAGLVYASDAKAMPELRVVATVPTSAHDAIEYPGVVLRHAAEERLGRDFLAFLATSAAREALQRAGFGLPVPAATQNAPADSR